MSSSQTLSFESGSSVRHRGIFPLPVPPLNAGLDQSVFSRSTRRKHLMHRHADEWVRDMVCTLNSMYAGSEFVAPKFSSPFKANLSQRLVIDGLRDSVYQLGKPPSDVDGRGALLELQAGLGYTGESLPASLAGYSRDLVSLPEIGGDPSSLDSILGPQAPVVLNTLRHKLLSPGVARARIVDSELKRSYVDPILQHQKSVYAEFVTRLFDSNLVEFRLKARESVGVFFVWKKSGKQRMVIDARRTNCWFSSPQKVSLATGTAFARIQVDAGPPIQVGGVDISFAFYRIALPSDFRDLFSLPPLTARALGLSSVQGQAVQGHQLVFPCIRVIPMGWSHALWICQRCHEVVVDSLKSIPPSLRFTDASPIPDMKPFLHTEYVDNFVALSQDVGLVGQLAAVVGDELNRRGLPTHPVEVCQDTLGWRFNESCPRVQMNPRRLWKLRLAILQLLQDGWASGKLVEKIVGHITFAALLRREILSCLQAVYVYIRKNYHVHSRLWPEVTRELRWVASLLPLIHRDLSAGWGEHVHATDASHWGRGVARAAIPAELVRHESKWHDKWRFSRAREHEVQTGLDVGGKAFGDILEFERDQLQQECEPIEELSPEFLDRQWHRVESNAWCRHEPIPILEGRTIVWLVQHLARSQANHGKRHMIISDSMTAILALSKGRGHSKALNRVCRQVGALSLACGFQLHYRWVASELNPADAPSRGRPVDFDFVDSCLKFASSHVASSCQAWRRQALRFYAEKVEAISVQQLGGGESKKSTRRHPIGQEAEEVGDSDPETRSSSNGGSLEHGKHDIPRDQEHLKESKSLISESLVTVPHLCADREDQDRQSEPAGCGCRLVDRPALLCRRRCGVSDDIHGLGASTPKRCQEDVVTDPCYEVHEGLQEDGSGTKSSASPLSYAGKDRRAHCSLEGIHGEHLAADDLAHCGATRRDVEASMEACGGSQQDQSLLVSDHVTLGIGGRVPPTLEDRRDGRERHPGHGVSSVDETPPEDSQIQAPARRACFQLSLDQSQQAVQPGSGPAELPPAWDSMPIPNSTRSCLNRSSLSQKAAGGGDEKRTLENLGVGEKVRTGRQTRTGVRVALRGRAEKVLRSRKQFSKSLASLFWMQSSPPGSIFLELFAGEGGISKAVKKVMKGKVTVVPIDILQSTAHDLEKGCLQSFIIHLIQLGVVVGIWMGTPCTSWSRARRNDGKGPPPLRSDEQPWGLPDLSDKDQARVKKGNNHLLFSLRVFRLCHRMGIPVTIENPSTSRMWLVKQMKRLMALPDVKWLITDYCQDGKPWRKRTGLLSSGVDLSSAVRKCDSKKGVCSFSGHKHVQLVGQCKGQFMTLAAQPYPMGLCRRVAIAYSYSIFEYWARPLMCLIGFHP